MKGVKKLFRDREGRSYKFWRYFAFCIGCLIFIISLLLLTDMLIYAYKNKKAADVITITKRINLSTSLGLSNTVFNQKEVKDLCGLIGEESVGLFYGNRFRAKAFTTGMLGFSTELFMETIDRGFLDKEYKDWKWEEGNDFVPIIIGNEFLSMYNFGFALSQGLPQLSSNAISELEFDLEVKGRNKTSRFKAGIVGVSSSINSILVPEEFMLWGNKNFGQNKTDELNKIMLKVKDNRRKEILEHIKINGWDINGLDRNNAFSLLYILVAVLFVIGLSILAISYINFLSHGRLLILRLKQEIYNLFCIGADPKDILSYWQAAFLRSMFMSLIFVSATYFIVAYYIHEYIRAFSIDISDYSIIVAYILSFGLFLILFRNIRRLLSDEISKIYPD